MTVSLTELNLLWENLIFLLLVTSFLLFVGWVWRESKPFSLPQPLPNWFKAWFSIVLTVGVLLPLIALVWWGFGLGKTGVVVAISFAGAVGNRTLLSHARISNFIRNCNG